MKYFCTLTISLLTALATGTPLAGQVLDVTLLSQNAAQEAANKPASRVGISRAGDVVTFESGATNLVSSDLNHASDVFLFSSALQRINVSSTGAELEGGSSDSVMSGDGKRVVFLGTPVEQAGTVQALCEEKRLLLYEAGVPGVRELVLSNDGQALNGFTYPMAFDLEGRYLLLASSATNVGAGLSAGTRLLMADTQIGTLEVLYELYNGTLYDEYPFEASMSADARFVVFNSCNALAISAAKLPELSVKCHCESQVFLLDRQSGEFKLLSANALGEPANSTCRFSTISADGKWIAFASAATNLVSTGQSSFAGNEQSREQIYLYDRVSSTLSLRSVNASNEPANGDCRAPSLSATGRYLSFASSASNLVPAEISASHYALQAYRSDLAQGTILRVEPSTGTTLTVSDSSGPVLSANGLAMAMIGSAPAANSSPESSSLQVYRATFQGEPDALFIDEPTVNSLMRSINASVRAVRPSIVVTGRKAKVYVQGFASVQVKRTARSGSVAAGRATGRIRKYASRYEITVRSAGKTKESILNSRSKCVFTLPPGAYRVSYRVRVSSKANPKALWSKKSRNASFRVR